MQEEVENKVVRLAVQSSKVSAQIMIKGLQAWYRHHENKKKENQTADKTVKGKQSVKELISQGQGVSSMDISDYGIRDFKRIANKYGVDFAVVKDKGAEIPKYTAFFKARDADAITFVLEEYAAKRTKSKERSEKEKPSVLEKLKKYKEKVASMPRKNKEKRKELEL